MEKMKLNEYKKVAQELISMDGDIYCMFDDREQCTEYLEQYFNKEKAKIVSEEIRKGMLRHDSNLQKLLAEVCGNKMMENVKAVMYLPSREMVISKMKYSRID